jgi:DNA-binding MarR family transcriptional regulator
MVTARPPVLFQMYAAYQRLGQLVTDLLAGTGIASEDAPLYNMLDRIGAVTPSELARLLGMAPSTITYRIRGLAARGHVVRVDNPDDGRSALLSLTSEGRDAWQAVFPPFVEGLRSAEDRLTVPQAEVGRSLDALAEAIDGELAERRRVRRRAELAARRS